MLFSIYSPPTLRIRNETHEEKRRRHHFFSKSFRLKVDETGTRFKISNNLNVVYCIYTFKFITNLIS
jgi:hypothetical protein